MPSQDARFRNAKFSLGQLAVTPGADDAFYTTHESGWPYLTRHAEGDWGDLEEFDRKQNDAALDLENPGRIFSTYRLKDGAKIYIITEWDRSVTTILLPDEY